MRNGSWLFSLVAHSAYFFIVNLGFNDLMPIKGTAVRDFKLTDKFNSLQTQMYFQLFQQAVGNTSVFASYCQVGRVPNSPGIEFMCQSIIDYYRLSKHQRS